MAGAECRHNDRDKESMGVAQSPQRPCSWNGARDEKLNLKAVVPLELLFTLYITIQNNVHRFKTSY